LKRAVAAMRDAGGGGAVVNIASISSFIAQPAFVPYSTSKGARTGAGSVDRGSRVPGCVEENHDVAAAVSCRLLSCTPLANKQH